MVFRRTRVDFRHIVRDRSRFVSDGDERDESGRSGDGDRIADFLLYDGDAVRRTVARLLSDEEKIKREFRLHVCFGRIAYFKSV